MLLLLACDGGGDLRDGAIDAPDGIRCAEDREARAICEGGACRQEPCRGDEVCQDAACIPWTESRLSADFTLTYTSVERGIAVAVVPGGFPRGHAEAIRFTFGDGVAGWGERSRHAYAAPGVYAVDLEVRLTGHRVLRASKVAVIDPIGEHEPLFLTVDEIPRYLNGSVPLTRTGGTPDDPSDDVEEPFILQVPTSGFTVDATVLDDPADPIDRASISLVASAPSGEVEAGEELVERLGLEDRGVTRGSWRVGEHEALPEAQVTLTLRARSRSGRMHESSLTIEAVALTPARDPFDRPMIWLFRDDTDFFDVSADPGGGLRSVAGPNGTPDLIEELARIGAQGDDPELNARYLAWIRDALRADVYRYFGIGPDGVPHDGIELTIAWRGEPGAPDPSAFSEDGAFSMMRFGGHFEGGFLGFSGFAPYNEARVDDSGADRGVASATLISTLLTSPVAAALEPLVTTPIGAHDADGVVLDPSFDPYGEHDEALLARHDTLRRIARYLALAIGSVTAHEMGHAMGLMPNGAPPLGYFGGVLDVSFIDPSHTDSHHADFPGLNLMQAGGGFTEVISEALASLELPRGADLIELAAIIALENRLSPYERAYLQRRLTYASFDGAPSGYRVGCR